MMPMNRQHPRFDMAMELLMCLKPKSDPAMKSDLAADFGCIVQRDLNPLIDELIQRGFPVREDNARRGLRGKGRVLWIGRKGWAKAKRASDRYWNTVYGGEREAA